MNCNICGAEALGYFKTDVLKKYNVTYYKCTRCGFVQSETPYWLEESYSSAITSTDIGLVKRNISLANTTKLIIDLYFNKSGIFVDYAGGYGLFVRMMRDFGYDFYRQDLYCKNIFAEHFDVLDDRYKAHHDKVSLVTAFEFMEHVSHPINVFEDLFKMSDSLLFSTLLQPDFQFDATNWWYVSPHTGQHVSFFNEKSLKYIADKFGKNYYKLNEGLHLITSEKINIRKVAYLEKHPMLKKIYYWFSGLEANRSLLQDDFQYVLNKNL